MSARSDVIEGLTRGALDTESAVKLLGVAAQLALLVLVMHYYRLESRALTRYIMPLTFVGFVVHALLPLSYRLPFFLLLSFAGIFVVLGASTGIWLIGAGLVLIGICHLPLRTRDRIGILFAVAALLVVLRLEWIPAPWSVAVWPLLGSMFMFRLLVYLYCTAHEKRRASAWHSLAYFFVLPNVVFPLFPVVDYDSFRRGYYEGDDPFSLYQTGVEWIFRGVTHLIAYRVVSYYFAISPADVYDIADLVRYLITNFLLYLRISGQFHLIVGVLYLFGFGLPRTNNFYLLSSSFTDFWRRINIYWKDFMLKVFYYPAYFRLKKHGPMFGILVSTAFVMFVTWFLHGYQWFWLRGEFLLTPQDIAFWTLLGLLMLGNSFLEAKWGRKRVLGTRSRTVREMAPAALGAVGTMATICVLWSLWTSASVEEWLLLWPAALVLPGDLEGLGTASLVAVVAVGMAIQGRGEAGRKPGEDGGRPGFYRAALRNGLLTLLLLLLSQPFVYSRLGEREYEVIRSLTQARLGEQDQELLEAGYYEDLVGVNRFNSELWELYSRSPQWAGLRDTEAGLSSDGFLEIELRPEASIIFKGAPLNTNRWGMRDKDYAREPSPGTYRIALLGASHSMGSGVADDEIYEALLEDRLNRENDGSVYRGYEILNFAVAGYSLVHNLVVLENKVLDFRPDAVFYEAHLDEFGKAGHHLAQMAHAGVELPYDYWKEAVRRAGIEPGTSQLIAERRMASQEEEIVAWTYRRMVEICRENDILPVWFHTAPTGADLPREEVARRVRLAQEAGFVVLDISDVYRGQDRDSLRIAEADTHPNAIAHRLLADRLYEALRRNRDAVPLGFPFR